jgi:hypothetical protein
MTIDTRAPPPDGTRMGTLWAGVLLGPLASLLALETGYVLAQRACATGRMTPVHLSFLVWLLVAAASGLLGWWEWRRWDARLGTEEGGREARSRFLALLGLLSGGLFSLVIVAQWMANLFLHPCQ